MTSDVEIRPLQEADAAHVCRIWVEGLAQSRKAAPWFLGRWFMGQMNQLRDASLAEAGDVGPNGTNLMRTYDGQDDRCMFVATLGDPVVVVGCCAVKIGVKETTPEPDSQIASIWRMSVDRTYRGHGIATKLMAASEGWAQGKGCTGMGLWTINPVAAKFYVDRMGYQRTEEFHIGKNPVTKRLIAPVGRFEKTIG